MKTEIEWHEYNEDDPSTYPPRRGNYLVTIDFDGRREFINLKWFGEVVKWGHTLVSVTHWAEVQPCME